MSEDDFDGIDDIDDNCSDINFTFDKVQFAIESRVVATTYNSFDCDNNNILETNVDVRSTNTYPMEQDHEEAQN